MNKLTSSVILEENDKRVKIASKETNMMTPERLVEIARTRLSQMTVEELNAVVTHSGVFCEELTSDSTQKEVDNTIELLINDLTNQNSVTY